MVLPYLGTRSSEVLRKVHVDRCPAMVLEDGDLLPIVGGRAREGHALRAHFGEGGKVIEFISCQWLVKGGCRRGNTLISKKIIISRIDLPLSSSCSMFTPTLSLSITRSSTLPCRVAIAR